MLVCCWLMYQMSVATNGLFNKVTTISLALRKKKIARENKAKIYHLMKVFQERYIYNLKNNWVLH